MAPPGLSEVSAELPNIRTGRVVDLCSTVGGGVRVSDNPVDRNVRDQRNSADKAGRKIRVETQTSSCDGLVREVGALVDFQQYPPEVRL